MFILVQLLQVYSLVILARVLMSWIPIDNSNPTVMNIVQFIYDITEPVLAPLRNALPPMGGIDFSPMILLVGLQLLANFLI
jgi:YggT family protein